MKWLRSYLAEPAVPNAPRRVWRDWAVVAVGAVVAIVEYFVRSDAEWEAMSTGWQVVSLLTYPVVAAMVMIRRTRPLFATSVAFGVPIAVMILGSILIDVPAGVNAAAILLLCPYALFRWGSGRDGVIGGVVVLVAGVLGIVFDPTTIGEAIGALVFLSIPVEAGLIVRYQSVARAQAIAEVRSHEREVLARELHDTVAHHVSAIAVQAQAGRAVAAHDPGAAVEVLAVIEEAASRTLDDMRSMVGALRDTVDAELLPQQGLSDLPRLARQLPRGLRLTVDDSGVTSTLPAAVEAAVYRIAREAVTNAARHARGASIVRITVTTEAPITVAAGERPVTVAGGERPIGSMVRLTVDDDGSGSGGGTGSGFGLLGMAERANLLGGTLDAGPTRTGWRVVAELPLRSDAAAHTPAAAGFATMTDSRAATSSAVMTDSGTTTGSGAMADPDCELPTSSRAGGAT